jgi:hypothetical protein
MSDLDHHYNHRIRSTGSLRALAKRNIGKKKLSLRGNVTCSSQRAFRSEQVTDYNHTQAGPRIGIGKREGERIAEPDGPGGGTDPSGPAP